MEKEKERRRSSSSSSCTSSSSSDNEIYRSEKAKKLLIRIKKLEKVAKKVKTRRRRVSGFDSSMSESFNPGKLDFPLSVNVFLVIFIEVWSQNCLLEPIFAELLNIVNKHLYSASYITIRHMPNRFTGSTLFFKILLLIVGSNSAMRKI